MAFHIQYHTCHNYHGVQERYQKDNDLARCAGQERLHAVTTSGDAEKQGLINWRYLHGIL
jgi:hypothetical protein